MYTAGKLSRKFKIARTTLLYYEKLGLINSTERSSSNYRLYDQSAVERLQRITELKDAGLSLKDIKNILENREPFTALLEKRLRQIGNEINHLKKQQGNLVNLLKNPSIQSNEIVDKNDWAQMLLNSGVTEDNLKKIHTEFESRFPETHHAFLQSLGIDEKEIMLIRHWSKELTMNKEKINIFYEIFENMDLLGPTSREITKNYLDSASVKNGSKVLDIGCGTGSQSIFIAIETGAEITSVDNHQPFLDKLTKRAKNSNVDHLISAECESMFNLPYPEGSFDCVWAEGSIYFIGLEKGLNTFKNLLSNNGYLAFSHIAWLDIDIPEEVKYYWQKQVADIASPEEYKSIIENCGFEVVSCHTLPKESWLEFYNEMMEVIDVLRIKYNNSSDAEEVFSEMINEYEAFKKFPNSVGYAFFLIKKI